MRLNPEYSDIDTIRSLHEIFYSSQEFPSVRLEPLFAENDFQAVRDHLKTLSFTEARHPLQYHYAWSPVPEPLQRLFGSQHFLSFLSAILAFPVTSVTASVYRLTWKHYTLLHDEATMEQGIDLIIDFTTDWDAEWGGSVVYVNGSGEYVSIPPHRNSLALVERDATMQSFIQYINHYAKQQYRYLVMGTVHGIGSSEEKIPS